MTHLKPTSAETAPAVEWADPARAQLFNTWLEQMPPLHGLQPATLHLASADASFRRYLRISSSNGNRIIMDAPPAKEDCRPFVHVAGLMAQAGLHAPEVLAWDEAHGFMLLSDLGQHTMMALINPDVPQYNFDRYMQAVDALIAWQLASQPGVLPPYDEALLRRELELFPEWYLGRHRGIEVEGDVRSTLDNAFKHIVAQNLSWPSVYVHRDFMPRNLMVAEVDKPPTLGILDFQDAVYGPITYDIASLMRDAFLTWDEDFVLDITIRYWQKARKVGLPVGDDFGEFYLGVEWMGLQRHLKIAGIFARLTLRDGKPKYLADTPRFIHYIRSTCNRYRELKPLLRLIDKVEGFEALSGFAYGRV
jgi:aminoglycoside/choline kinase family phosphotransferase